MVTDPQPIQDTLNVPFNQSYWVQPGLLLAGCYPGAEDHEQAHRQLKGLVACGIRHIINLMQTAEINRSDRILGARRMKGKHG